MKEFLKKKISLKMPLNSTYYQVDLDQKFHVMQASRKSYYKKALSKLTFNELCILFKTDKATLYEDIIYNVKKKKYVRSLIAGHGYSQYYEKIKKDKIKNLIEIGSYKGASGLVFSAYFQNAKIFCLDISFKLNKLKYKNSKKILLDQSNIDSLKKFVRENKLTKKIDLISDDGAHLDKHIMNSFETLFPNISKGGYYFIEDIDLKRTKKVYDFFKGNKNHKYKDIKKIDIFKSNINKSTQSKAPQNYLIIIKKK